MTMPNTTGSRRTTATAPTRVTEGMSLLEYLAACTPPLHQKIMEIAMTQMHVPAELREDAAQDIRLMWLETKPDISKYQLGQIASYAHRIARHASLRLRRELGSPVRLPGSAFRKRKDGSSYVTPGVLAAPLEWSEIDGWFDVADGTEQSGYTQMASVVVLPEFTEMTENPDDTLEGEDDPDDQLQRERMELIERRAKVISRPQLRILTMLVEGSTVETIQQALDLKKSVLLREIAVIASIVGPDTLPPVRAQDSSQAA